MFFRCQAREKEVEIKEMKEQMTELVGILRHSESWRREMEKQLKQREQTAPVATTPPVRFLSAFIHERNLGYHQFQPMPTWNQFR